MQIEEFEKLQEEENYNPAVIFSVRSKDMVESDRRYKFVIFNHKKFLVFLTCFVGNYALAPADT